MFSSLSRRRVMVLVVLTCLLLITLDRRGNPFIDRARGVFATILRPVDTATEAIVLPLERAWYGMTNYDDLERENAALRDQIEHMKGSDIEARSAVLQYRELLKLGGLTSKWKYDVVVVEVVGASPSNFQNTVEISVGSNKGVQVGMPVTDGAGLVGRITKVFPASSIVLLITAPEYAISARVLSTDDQLPTDGSVPAETVPVEVPTGDSGVPGDTGETTTSLPAVVRETGTLEGVGNNKALLLRFTDSTSVITNVKVGAVVDTAGGNSSLAPQGIPIGRITNISVQQGSSSALVEVTPNADLHRLNFVAVVLYLPNNQAVGH